MSNMFVADLAKQNSDIRKRRFKGEIDVSIECAHRYTLTDIRRNAIDISACGEREHSTVIDVVDGSIQYYLRVMLKHMSMVNSRNAILNPANYIIPGGNYMQGDLGYEESICATTTLYEVLSKCTDYYDWNASHENKGMGTNVCLYTPRIVVCDNCNNDIGVVDVITCAAPNYDAVPLAKSNKAMRDRIELVLNVAVRNEVENLILCGFGCNYKRSDIEYIANAFYELCTIYQARFESITFLMDSSNGAGIFKKVFSAS